MQIDLFYEDRGVMRLVTPAYASQSNRVAERKN